MLVDDKNTLTIALQRHSVAVLGARWHIEILQKEVSKRTFLWVATYILLFSALIVWHDSICDTLIDVNRSCKSGKQSVYFVFFQCNYLVNSIKK